MFASRNVQKNNSKHWILKFNNWLNEFKMAPVSNVKQNYSFTTDLIRLPQLKFLVIRTVIYDYTVLPV